MLKLGSPGEGIKGDIGERVRDGGRGCEGRDEWILRGR